MQNNCVFISLIKINFLSLLDEKSFSVMPLRLI